MGIGTTKTKLKNAKLCLEHLTPKMRMAKPWNTWVFNSMQERDDVADYVNPMTIWNNSMWLITIDVFIWVVMARMQITRIIFASWIVITALFFWQLMHEHFHSAADTHRILWVFCCSTACCCQAITVLWQYLRNTISPGQLPFSRWQGWMAATLPQHCVLCSPRRKWKL